MKGLFWNSRGLSDLAKIRYISDAILFGILMPQCSICLLFNKLDKFNWILMAKRITIGIASEDFFDKVTIIPGISIWWQTANIEKKESSLWIMKMGEENNILSRPFSEKEIKDFYQKFWDIINLMGHTTRANMEGQVGGAHNMKFTGPRAIFPLRYLGIPIHYRNLPMYMIIGPC
ncbi:hypothetical protein ACJX0J_035043 [Zea mays]